MKTKKQSTARGTTVAYYVEGKPVHATTESNLIGLSLGPLGNTARLGDRGAEARGGGWETDFSEPMAKIVYDTVTGVSA